MEENKSGTRTKGLCSGVWTALAISTFIVVLLPFVLVELAQSIGCDTASAMAGILALGAILNSLDFA